MYNKKKQENFFQMLTKNLSNLSRNQVEFISLDELVPQDHILRKIDELIDFSFVYDYVEDLYSKDKGRPSEDPVVLIKLCFLQYFYGIKSMRATVKQIQTDLAFKWFLGIGLREEPMHYSTFFKNFERRFRNTDLFEKIFEHSVELAMEKGLIDTERIYVDGTHVKAHANANKYTLEEKEPVARSFEKELLKEVEEERIKRGKKGLKKNEKPGEKQEKEKEVEVDLGISEEERLAENLKIKEHEEGLTKQKSVYEAAELSEDERKVLEEKEIKAVVHQLKVYGEIPALDKERQKRKKSVKKGKVTSGRRVSKNDPESGLFYKDEFKKMFAYNNQVACDDNGWILACSVEAGNVHDSLAFESVSSKILDYSPLMVVADNGYRSPAIARTVIDSGAELLLPYKCPMTKEGFFTRHDYAYDERFDCYICPNNEVLSYRTTNRNGKHQYKSDKKKCAHCPLIDQCTKSANQTKVIERHIWQDYLDQVEETRYKRGASTIYKRRKETIERVFAQAKEDHGYRYTNMKGKDKMRYKTFMTFFAMNVKKLASVA